MGISGGSRASFTIPASQHRSRQKDPLSDSCAPSSMIERQHKTAREWNGAAKMKFMKLGTRPDTFFNPAQSIRSASSEVPADLKIQVNSITFHLHKFPLLSKCLHLQKLCSQLETSSMDTVIQLQDVPGGAEAFEICAKFCYGITITLSARNLVPVRCAAEYLQMTDAADHRNLAGKLDAFLDFCVLRRWKDTLAVLKSTPSHAALCEELGITGSCVNAVGAAVVACKSTSWWAEDTAELEIDQYWRVMAAVKSAGVVPGRLFTEALQIYACRWLREDEQTGCAPLVVEKIASLLPAEKRSASCGFLLWLLKAADLSNAPTPLRSELSRRIGAQLEEASVDDLLTCDVDLVRELLEDFLQQEQIGLGKLTCSKLRVAKLIDGYLQQIAGSEDLPMEKLIGIAEAVPDFARVDHDDLYKAIDVYLRAHPDLDKNSRKQLCRIMDCKKLSVEACVHAAQNERLPLRVVLQVLFFEQSRASIAAATSADGDGEDGWSGISRLKCPPPAAAAPTKLATLRMKLEEDADGFDGDLIAGGALMRSYSVRLKALHCYLPKNPRRMISKLLAMNKSASDRR